MWKIKAIHNDDSQSHEVKYEYEDAARRRYDDLCSDGDYIAVFLYNAEGKLHNCWCDWA